MSQDWIAVETAARTLSLPSHDLLAAAIEGTVNARLGADGTVMLNRASLDVYLAYQEARREALPGSEGFKTPTVPVRRWNGTRLVAV